MEFVKPLDPYTLQPVAEVYRDRSAGVKGHGVQGRAIADPQKEIVHVIDFFLGDGTPGSAQDPNDLEQLRKAIQALFLNNAIFPEVLTPTKTLSITNNGDGTITVGASQSWRWRGFKIFNTDNIVSADRTLATAALKTYHLRWNAPGTGNATPAETYPDGRFELKDMAGLTEAGSQYDSTEDQMLVARVITDGGNVPTITNLANVQSLMLTASQLYTSGNSYLGGIHTWYRDFVFPINWARTPKIAHTTGYVGAVGFNGNDKMHGGANQITNKGWDRYSLTARIATDWDAGSQTEVHAQMEVSLGA